MRLTCWRGWLLSLAALLIASQCWGDVRAPAPAPNAVNGAPTIEAASAILVDADTGAVLFSKNAHQRRPMASTTKIMTAIIILQRGRLDQMTTVSERASKAGQSSVWLQPGETLSLEDLLKGILIKSGNDAAVAAAECVGGSVEGFVEKMNARARELGAGDTHFVNPHGLYQPGHYSTAADLALLARHAMLDPTFRSIVRSKTEVIADSGKPWDRLLVNHNKLLWLMPEADGIKTGFVKESGQCLVFSATREGWRLIGVVLDSPRALLYQEAQALLEYGFASFRQVRFAREGEGLGDVAVRWGSARKVPVVAAEGLSMVVPRASTDKYHSEKVLPVPRAPVRRGQKLGRLDLVCDGRTIKFSRLIAGAAVGRARWVIALAWAWRGAAVMMVGAVVTRTAFKISRRRRRAPRRRGAIRL